MYAHLGQKARRIHLLDRGSKHGIDPRLLCLVQIARHVARVRRKIFLWAELFRVDKD